jgi:uncharacterized cupin superfamily protein
MARVWQVRVGHLLGLWPAKTYRVRAHGVRSRAASAEQHAHHCKDEFIVTATMAIITSFLSGATIYMLAINLC